LYSLGQVLGTLDSALQSFQHPAAHRALKWDVAHAGWIRDYLPYLTDAPRRAWVEQCLSDYERSTLPALAQLRTGVIYNDANDHNLLVNAGRVVGVIDFGDTVETQTVCELAIALMR
jgi:Ser/Thr protein kinase RdoA (MazF antagonist)